MRKLLFVAFIVCLHFTALAQEQPQYIYSQIIGSQLISTAKNLNPNVVVSINFGEGTRNWQDKQLKDATTGKPVVFTTMVDALNYMNKQGWEFEHAYAINVGNQNIHYYLIKKLFTQLGEEEKQLYLKGSLN